MILLALLLVQEAPELLWKLETAAPSYGSGALGDIDGDGKMEIVFGAYFNDEHLYAVNAEDGSVLWKFKSEGGPLDASVAIADLDGDRKLEILAADSQTGALFCLNGSGKRLWRTQLPSGTDSPPAVADLDGDGKIEIVVGTMTADKNGRVVVLDASTRKERWSAKVPGHVQSEPALVDLNGDKILDVVVTCWHGDKSVRALSGKSGAEIWKYSMAGDIYHGVSVVDDRIVATSTGGDVCLLDAKGKKLWSRKGLGYLFAPSTVGDLDKDGKPEIVVGSDRLYVFDVEGAEKWRSPVYGSIARGAAIVDGVLYFGASDRRFRALDGATGKELWSYDATIQGHVYEGIDHAPLVADFDGDGTLDVFFVAGKGTSDETQSKNYGRAYALRAGKGKGTWGTFRGNLRRTGTN